MTSIDESIKAFTKDLRGYNYTEFINKLANRHKDKEIWITEVGCSKNIDALSKPEAWIFETEITDNKIQEIFYSGVLGAFTNNLNLNNLLNSMSFVSSLFIISTVSLKTCLQTIDTVSLSKFKFL